MNVVTPLISIGSASAEEIAENLRAQVGEDIGRKFLRLRVDVPREAHAVRNAIAETRAEEKQKQNTDKREIARLSTGTSERLLKKHFEEEISRRQGNIVRIEARVKDLDEEFRTASESANDASALGAAIREGVAGLRKIKRAKPLPIPSGWNLDTARAERIDRLGQIAEAEAAPNHPDAIKRDIIAALDRRAERANVQINLRNRSGDPANLASHFMLGVHGSSLIGDGGTNFLIWTLRDLIEERLLELVPDTIPGALTASQREKRLTALRADLLRIERIEEQLIMQAEARGQKVQRRPDADFRAVLGIEIVEAR
ncbi:hypothetical protein [Roseinatronobacter alkalisoli]|uniref:Uncharacterized protein n=1 Tax=Roseinatronobacter alkalisoli TaxID=3028235 RepID=A0ABT5TFR4_9RHOB|nr:hypothetical protein [Roseinatronobacter sp. HJB301]MDD7973201.1 hypothetical protein [Roseinatronobacter sp. HJB301]